MKKSIISKNVLAMLLSTISLSQSVVFAGVGAGNGAGDSLPYKGFKKNEGLENTSSKPLIERNLNDYTLTYKTVENPTIKAMSTSVVGVWKILNLYDRTFPADKEQLANLYKSAVNKTGDFKKILSRNNPFYPYLSTDTTQTKVNELLSNKIYPLDSIQQVLEGLTFEINVNVNEHLQKHTCPQCTVADYKPIDKDGISLRMNCYLRDDYSSSSGEAVKFQMGNEIKIYSQTDSVKMSIPFSSDFANYIRMKSCDHPNDETFTAKIICDLEGSTKADTDKLVYAFGKEALTNTMPYGVDSYLKFETLKSISESLQNQRERMNSFFPNKLETEVDYRSNRIIDTFNQLTPFYVSTPYTVKNYYFNSVSYDSELNFKTEEGVAEYVRRAFIYAYDHTKF